MSNDQLRAALARAGLSSEKLARSVGVDAKTVDRWLAGRVPHPRTRSAVAECLDEHERFLWPDAPSRTFANKKVGAEILSAYAYRSDLSTDRWWDLIQSADERIDLLGYTLYFLPMQHPQFVKVLARKAHAGCRIRIVMADPASRHVADREAEEDVALTIAVRIHTTLKFFAPLRRQPEVEMRFQDVPLYNSVFRFDGEMLVTPHLYGTQGSQAPLLHLRNLGEDGLYSRFEEHFDAIWEKSLPIPDGS
ncbi:DUF5919 domain-containing protein [Longispora sp. NPDC051575]|uniref:DUF5919 domain-containing protein n=1 Tax=Longispora sp. NPDC051575 TaxID=3154943 RepID=UPI00342F5589